MKTMKMNKFSGTRIKEIKFRACTELISASKICSPSKLTQNKPISTRKKTGFTENKSLETKPPQKKNCQNVISKTSAFSLPTLIRIRATDREGNTIEVTY